MEARIPRSVRHEAPDPAEAVAEYQRCASCDIADRDQNRRRLRYPCPVCGVPGAGGLSHFPSGALALAELMRDHAAGAALGVVLPFCALGEVLLQHFLLGRMEQMGLPEAVRARLLDDHPTVKARQDRLFLTLTGETWKAAVKRLEEASREDFNGPLTFWRKAADARDWYLFRGFAWSLSPEMPAQCREHLPGLLALFAALHNEFVFVAPPPGDPEE